ncbi:MAG: radical SAM protein, partial [Deltaproteobacteria bacterium]|nr:radical SAM protein [Deltaproteobacteria bacterium]
MREALFWESLPESAVRCHLCRLECTIPKGGRGRCRTRENHEGRLVSLVYGQLIAAHVDPV